MTSVSIPFVRIGLLAAMLAISSATSAQQAPADRQDAALAYAQCVRDNGYPEFPDPDTEGGFRFLIEPGNADRFRTATTACRDLAPEGLRDNDVTPEELDVLIRLAQCVRENGVPAFPDPGPKGNFDLSDAGIGPQDARLEAAMAACRAESGQGNVRITIGG